MLSRKTFLPKRRVPPLPVPKRGRPPSGHPPFYLGSGVYLRPVGGWVSALPPRGLKRSLFGWLSGRPPHRDLKRISRFCCATPCPRHWHRGSVPLLRHRPVRETEEVMKMARPSPCLAHSVFLGKSLPMALNKSSLISKFAGARGNSSSLVGGGNHKRLYSRISARAPQPLGVIQSTIACQFLTFNHSLY